MAFNYTEEQAEELLSEMYAEIADLRETMSKHYHFRDRFMERPLYDLLKENDYEPNWQKLQQLLDDYSIHYCEDTEIKILVKEEKVTSGNCPSDFYEKKSYFKNLVNELATKKYKSQLVTNPSYNYISINIFHDREIVCVGIMLARKVIGITRVYDCIDGFYLEIENLDINSHLYGIELLPERGEAGYIGPNCIEIEDTSKEIYYHVYLDRKVLKELGCDNIFQMNFITTTGKHSIKYGDRDEHFDHDFIKSNCGFAHACQFPSNPQRLSKNMQECKGFKPTQEELTMIRCDKFEDPPEKERTSLADRVLATQSKENRAPRAEAIDFSEHVGLGVQRPKGRPPPGLGMRPPKGGAKPGNRGKKGPAIKMTKAMELKMKAVEDKKKKEEMQRSRTCNYQDNNYISPSRPTNLPRRSPLKNSIRKPSPRIGMHRDNRGGYSIRTPQRDQRSNNRGDDRRIVPLGERPIRGDDRRITPLEERQTRDDRGNFRDNRGGFRDDRRDLRNDRKDFRDERKNDNPSFRSIRRNRPSHFPGGRFERNQTFNDRLDHQRDFSKFNDPADDGHIRGRVSDVSMKSCTPFKNEPPPSFNGSFKNTQDNPHNPFNRSSQESSNPFAQNNAHDNPYKRSNTTVVNPYSKGDPLGVAFAGNTTKWEKSLREGVFDRKLTTHPTSTNQFVLKKPEVIKLGLPKPPSSFAMPLKQPKTNPFSDANYKPDIPDNPFTKKRAEKENTSFNRQQPIFKKETPVAPQRPVLRQMPVQNILPPQDLDSQEVPQYHNEEKSRGALISEVLDYFLHSDVAEVLGGSTSPHTKSNVKQNEVYQLVIKPLELAFLRDIPVNDCFTELYEKNRGHDVQLYFRRNCEVLNAHKIVLSTSKYFEKLIESSLRHRPEYTKDGKLILRFEDFDSSIFARVLKIMYKSKVGDVGVPIDEARSMFKLACKIRAKHVQRHIIVHLLLPNLTIENCLYILNDSFNQLERNGVDDSNLTLFELTKLFCARRFIKILSLYGDIVHKLKKELLLKLITKSLYFISDESNIKDFIKLLYSKGAYNDMFELCTLTSKEFSKAVTFDLQDINIDRVLPNIGFDPVQYDLITEETVAKRVSKEPGSKDQYQKKEERYTPKRSPLSQSNSSYEFSTPVENKVSSSNKISCKIPNLELSLEVNHSDLERGGVTYFSECFHSFSATWNLKVDIKPNGDTSVYLIERDYKKPIEESNNFGLVYRYDQSRASKSSKRINNGQNALFSLNFKSVFFSVTICDSKLSKEFKLFHSFSKDQNEIVGCTNFFNMSHLSNQNMITLKVRIDERILHSAVLHIIAQRFINYSRIEEETDPEIEKKVKYCLLKNGNLRVSEEKKTNYEERLIREKREWNEEYVQPRRKKRYSTPPSVLKQKMVFSDRERDRRYARHDDQLQQYRGYLDLTYYDLSFILKSDHLNIPTELKALHAVYRYGIKVLNDPGVANRLIKCIRFSYLELSDIMNVARSNLKFFSNSKEFQNKLSCEIIRRMKSGIIGSNQGVDPPRSQYISKKVEIPTHVGEEIARWMVQWEDNRRDKRMIEKLRTQLTKYQDEKSYLKKKHEKDMHEMLRQQEKIRRNATLKFQSSDDTKDQRYNKPTRRSNELKPNKKYSAMEMLGIRRAPISKSEVESSNKKKPITEDWRQKKIEERKQERKFEEQKQKREIEEIKTNPLSLKRREDQQRRKEQGTSYGKRFADANMHTPIVPNQKRSSVTYTRNARRRNQSRWKIPVPDFCSIF